MRTAGAVALVLASLVSFALDAGAQSESGTSGGGKNGISVVQVEGLLDPPTASLLKNAIENANEQHRTMLVIQFNSRGAVDVDVQELVRAITQSKVPVIASHSRSGSSWPAVEMRNLATYSNRPNPPESDKELSSLDIIKRLLARGDKPKPDRRRVRHEPDRRTSVQ